MTDQPPPRVVMAVVYIRWLRWIDPSEALHDVPYVGQAVRGGFDDPLKCAAARWREENGDAKREDKVIGLMAALDMFGRGAFFNEVVEFRVGPREEVQKWANEREIALIAVHGGPLRDPFKKLKQTLNLTKGGKGNVNFEAMDALRTLAWTRFQSELQQYVDCHCTSLVPFSYVSPSRYGLGNVLNNIRQRRDFLKSHPNEDERVAWLQTLPHWTWRPSECNDALHVLKLRASSRAKDQHAREVAMGMPSLSDRLASWRSALSDDELAALLEQNAAAHRTPESRKLSSDIKTDWWQNASAETVEMLRERVKRAKGTNEARCHQAVLNMEWNAAASPQQSALKAERISLSKRRAFESSIAGLSEVEKSKRTAARAATKLKNDKAHAALKTLTVAVRAVPGYENVTKEMVRQLRRDRKLPPID